VLAVGLPMRCRSAWDRDRQTRSDQRGSTMKRRAGATTTGKKCPAGTTLDTLGNRLRPGRSPSEHDRAATTQVSRNGYGHPCSMAKHACPAHPARAFPGPGAGSGPACRTRFGRASPTPLQGQADTPTGGRSATLDARCPDRQALGTRPCLCATPPWQASRRPDGGLARFAPNAEWAHQTSAIHDGGARPPASVDQR
jgi:hypothetical protein